MSKGTIQNMKLIILEMDKLINNNMDFSGLKHLSSSYENLLDCLNYRDSDFKNHELTNEVKSQLNAIINLTKKTESNSLPNLLSMGIYSEVNSLTTTVVKLKNIMARLGIFLADLYEKYNDTVLIVSNDISKSIRLQQELIKNEIVVSSSPYLRNHRKVITEKSTYEAITYSENHRGKRVDYVYIDSGLSLEEIGVCKTFLKDSSKYKMF